MNKKIIVFVLLFVFLVGVGVPEQVKAANTTETTADDVKYTDVEDFMHRAGYIDFIANNEAYYFVFNGTDYLYVLEVLNIFDKNPYCCYAPNIYSDFEIFIMGTVNTGCNYYKYNNFEIAGAREDYSCITSSSYSYKSHSVTYNTFSVKCVGTYVSYGLTFSNLVYSDLDIYSSEQTNKVFSNDVTSLVYESNVLTSYSFEQWCSDAGLNCVASSNETEDTFPFEFDQDNWYIVRKNRVSGSEYTWYLSEFKRYDSDTWHLYSKLRAMADNTLGIADLYVDYTMKSVPVSNYVYDSSGGGWLFVDRPGFILQPGENSIDDVGISFGSSMPIVFSNVDIYSDVEQSSVYYSAFAEYVDSEVFYPDLSPTSTPTPTPISNSGSSDLGGNVVAGGGIDFIISIFALIWSKIASIPMYVDGFQITIQQLYVYGALVTIVGGAIWAFIRRK